MAAATDTHTATGRGTGPLAWLAPDEPDSAARRHLVAAMAFLVVAGGLGALYFIRLRYPIFYDDVAWASFGRLRAMMLTAVAFGALTLAHVGAAYYLVPRLSGVALVGERLANLNLWFVSAVLVIGLGSLAAGFGDGRELLEMPILVDVLLLAALIVPTALVTATLVVREEPVLYVSLWYVVAGLYWMVALFALGNVPGLTDVASLLQTSFFASGLIHLWLVGMATGAIYYVVPKAADAPLYSRGLAHAGFWSLALVGVWAGPARFVHGPLPDWLESVSAAFGLALLVSAIAVVANLAGTLTGRWNRVRESAPLMFAVAGAVALLLVGAVGALAGFRSIATVIGLTTWWEGQLHAELFGVAGLWMAAFVYWAFPRLYGRELFSLGLARAHLWLTVVGTGGIAVMLWLAGVTSGTTWLAGVRSGAFLNHGDGYAVTVAGLAPFLALTALFGLVALAGQVVFAYNLVRTYTSAPAAEIEVLLPAADDQAEDRETADRPTVGGGS